MSKKQRFGRWIANRCGLFVVTYDSVRGWMNLAEEYNRVAGDYDVTNPRLTGLNDGRCQSLNRCASEIMSLNPN